MWKPLKLAPWIVAVGAAWSFGFAYNIGYGGETSFLARMYRQKMAIAADVKAPRRLLLIGGSGVHHTFNSKLLEEKLGIPVINLGLDGPIGLDLILSSNLTAVRPGDLVLLVPEDTILTDDDGVLERTAPFAIATGRPGAGNIPLEERVQAFWMQGVPTLRGIVKSTMDLIDYGELRGYYSDPLSDRGDSTVVKPRFGPWWNWSIDRPMSPYAARRITQFRQQVEAKGGTLLLAMPWVYAPPTPKNLEYARNTASTLASIAPTFYDPKTFNLQASPEDFADTHYHLKFAGRDRHSEQLIGQLKPFLAKQPPQP